jgi:zinc transporter 9
LVGTALAVIIPEGVRSLLHENVSKDTPNQTEPHQDKDVLSVIGISLVLGFIFMLMVDQVSNTPCEMFHNKYKLNHRFHKVEMRM